MLHLGVVSIMPEMFNALDFGVTGRAIEDGLVQVNTWNPRDYAKPPHFQVDDKPYGGGPGMVMLYEPLHQAISAGKHALGKACKTVYLSPQGRQVKQEHLCALVENKTPLLFVAGRYEGIDERVLKHDIDEEWSLGDFVLSGGELAAMVYMDALVRLVPGGLGHPDSKEQDSFMQGLLDHPHYTRPPVVEGLEVPEVLMQGHHNNIEQWRRKQALGQTWLKRPDLLSACTLTDEDKQLLTEFKQEHGQACK